MATSFQQYTWPAINATSSSPSTGNTGVSAPAEATEIGGVDAGGILRAVKTNTSGNFLLANDSIVKAQLQDNAGTAITVGQKTSAASVPVVIASDQSAVPISSTQLPTTLGTKTTANSTAVNIASDQTVPVSAASLPLPSGASTSALQTTGNTSLSSIDGKLASLGQKNMVGSEPVVIASDQSAIPVSQSGTWNISNVSGTVSLPTGAATETTLAAASAKLPATLGQKTSANSLAIVVASDQSAIPVTSGAASSSAVTSVSGSASSVSLLASNASRKGAAFFNDSGATLYLKLGATASTTSYTVQILSNGYYEIPVGAVYTGAIDGIWSSATGAVRITELS